MAPMTTPCECENAAHFEDGRGHNYGHECDVEHVTQVRTMFGVFTVCVDCARTHMKDWQEYEDTLARRTAP